MQDIQNLANFIPEMNDEMVKSIIATIIVVFVLWLARMLVVRMIMSYTEDIRTRYMWRKTTGYITFILGAILIASAWSQGLHDVATFLAVLSAGIAIALRDILSNIAGWIFILWVRPLSVGDRIQMGNHRGDVIDTGIFHVKLMEIGNWVSGDQSTGRIISIPNSRIFTTELANYSRGFQYIWNEIPVMVTFESNWQEAKKILLEIARKYTEDLSGEAEKRVLEASKRFMIFYSKLTPTVYTSVADSGVLLTIRYLCEPRRRRGTEETIWEDILTAFAEHDDIDFAYPTQRFYDNMSEGKPELKPDDI